MLPEQKCENAINYAIGAILELQMKAFYRGVTIYQLEELLEFAKNFKTLAVKMLPEVALILTALDDE